MTYPKKRPCPKCGTPGEDLAVYRYDNGWQHVECDAPRCRYMGPGEGSVLAAIRSHNLQAPASA